MVIRQHKCERKEHRFRLMVLAFILLPLFLPKPAVAAPSNMDSLLSVVRNTSSNSMITALSTNAFEKSSKNPEEAIKLSLEAIVVSKKEDFIEGLIFNYRLLGNLYYQAYEYEKAINSYDQCIEYTLPRNDSVTLRECYLNKGVIYFTKGLNSKAMDDFLLALKYSKNLDKEKEYNNLGAVFFNEAEYEEAYKFYNKALEILQIKNDQYGILVAYNNIGDVFKMMRKYDVAVIYYNKVLSGDETEYPELTISCLNNIYDTPQKLDS